MKTSAPEKTVELNSRRGEKLKIPLVVILGPTGVGKSEIAIQLAESFQGEIVSADSRSFYRGMDIGTAKPSAEERLRVPHHLIDIANPDEILSLAIFQDKANEAISKIYLNHHLPFLVGGTGQFLRAIFEGWNIPPVEPKPRLRQVLQKWSDEIGPVELHSKLSHLDPSAADAIEPTNVRRTIRALEVILSTGERFSTQRVSGQPRYETLIVGLTLPRDVLYQRIDDRIDRMINAGLIDEVRRLLDDGYTSDLPTLSAIGYSEIIGVIHGKISLDEAIRQMKRRTRYFVRRQANWFKQADPKIHWFSANENPLVAIRRLIGQWVNRNKWDLFVSDNL